MNMSGCKSEMLDKISLDMTNISEQISLYLSKIEDELDNLATCCDISELALLKNHFNNAKSSFMILESNIDKTAVDMIKVKAHYQNYDTEVGLKINVIKNNIEKSDAWHE